LLEAKRLGAFRGIAMGGSLYLSLLLFVDYTFRFYDGYRRDDLKLKETLNLNCITIGMKINTHNSIASFSEIKEDNINFLSNLFPLQ